MIDQTLAGSAEMPALLPEPSSLPVSSSRFEHRSDQPLFGMVRRSRNFLLASDAGWANAAV